MNLKRYFSLLLLLLMPFAALFAQQGSIRVVLLGEEQNDLYQLLKKQDAVKLQRVSTAKDALRKLKKGDILLCMADGYPKAKLALDASFYEALKKKNVKAYVEFPSFIPGHSVQDSLFHGELERAVVSSDAFGAALAKLTILGINDTYLLQTQAAQPLLILGKVAGLNTAAYGIDDVKQYPLLFKQDGNYVATTKLSGFATGRYGPNDAWKAVWNHILQDLSGKPDFALKGWLSYVNPAYGKHETLPANAKKEAVRLGVDWFDKAKLYVDPSWQAEYEKFQGNGETPFGPQLPNSYKVGDGSLGLLEGHASKIYFDGSQQFRYWLRADVQGEASFALAAAGKYLGTKAYDQKAKNVVDFVFDHSNLRAEERNDPNSPSYGLIGWSVTHPYVYYGDDNARALLGMIGAASLMDTHKWDEKIVEAILANFRTTGKFGFREGHIRDKAIQEKGWPYFFNREIEHYAPHFESWNWATFLWLYDKTGYKPLLERTKTGIRMMMAAYPDKWEWTNGLQQERARMLLVLAWLLRVEDTAEHRAWLDQMVESILANQDSSGAIMEWLGAEDKGKYGKTSSNAAYGNTEATLIFTNGDPIADMLYTTNFAYFGLNEAYHASKNPKYKAALDKMSDFLIRIQVRSDKYKDLDGAWFRGFEYDKWEYWGSNADAGWGVWGTLSGWTQSWIVATQVLTGMDQSFWDLSKDTQVEKYMPAKVKLMMQE
ncbi:hypothetical protein [Sphingobacterium humi]|nr:hypothetical protein [Sphingobacterium humi]